MEFVESFMKFSFQDDGYRLWVIGYSLELRDSI